MTNSLANGADSVLLAGAMASITVNVLALMRRDIIEKSWPLQPPPKFPRLRYGVGKYLLIQKELRLTSAAIAGHRSSTVALLIAQDGFTQAF